MCSYNFLWAFLNKVQSCRVDWFYERHPLSDGHIAPTQPPKLSRWGHSWFFGTGVTKAAWSQMGFSSCLVLEVQCWEQKQESQARGDGHALRLWGGKATQSWQGTTGRGSSQNSAKGLRRRCTLITLIWLPLSRVHISVPIHKKQCPFGPLWPVPVGAIPLLPWFAFFFMYQAWLHQGRACHKGMFQDRVKTICSRETSRVPREGVKPGECWSVSCLCYDFCHVTQSRPSTSPASWVSRAWTAAAHLTSAQRASEIPAEGWLIFMLILPRNRWVLTTFTPKHRRTGQRGGGWVWRGCSPVSCRCVPV